MGESLQRAVSENKYEAVVTGYKKETVKSQNFKGSTYDSKVVYFPKVKYTDEEGKEVVKTLDMTSNHPPAIGQHLKITDAELKDSANSIGLDWVSFIFGGVFTGVTAFFAGLLSTYMTKYTLKRRVVLSLYIALIVMSVNISCMVLIYLRQ